TENKEKRQAEFHQLQVLLAEQEERVKNSRANTRKLEEELAGLKEQHSTLSSELNMMNEIEAQETEEQIEEKIHHYSHEKNALSESIQKKRSKRLEMSTYVEDEERELK